jgi:hypothetical protein
MQKKCREDKEEASPPESEQPFSMVTAPISLSLGF